MAAQHQSSARRVLTRQWNIKLHAIHAPQDISASKALPNTKTLPRFVLLGTNALKGLNILHNTPAVLGNINLTKDRVNASNATLENIVLGRVLQLHLEIVLPVITVS